MKEINKNNDIKPEKHQSTYGENFRVSISGTSHGNEILVTIDGVPEGTVIDYRELREFMERRQGKEWSFLSQRKEPDEIIFKKGVVNFGADLGIVSETQLVASVENKDIKSGDYEKFRKTPRPGHSDFTALMKDGDNAEIAGGGRFSGRLTVGLCIAGGIAKQLLEKRDIFVLAHVVELGGDREAMDFQDILGAASGQGDSVGGIIECIATGLKAGEIGDFLWEGLEGKFAKAVFGIPGVKGVEFGSGFEGSQKLGSQNNDAFAFDKEGNVITLSNNHGGILGGISSGMPIIMKVALKPTPSISKPQQSVNLKTGKVETIQVTGRHDSSIVPKAVACVESAVAMVILDELMGKENV